MFEQEYKDWLSMPATKQMKAELAQVAEQQALEILNRRESKPLDDQYLKGYIFGLSAAAGWMPELIDDEGNEVPDAL